MDEKLLRIKAAQIDDNTSDSSRWNRIDEGYSIRPQLTFTCNGTISELLLAVEVQDFRAEFPTFDIWRIVPYSKNMVKVSSTEISLKPSQITTDGVITYTLPSPVAFQTGDMIGIYQPPFDRSWVRLYAAPPSSNIYTSPSFIDSTLTSDLLSAKGNTPLIHPMTGLWLFNIFL